MRKRKPHYARNVFLFFLAAAGTAWLRPEPAPPDRIQAKLLAFAEVKDEIDVIFFGSSLTHHNVIPAAFDEAARSEGLDFRSFNMALHGAQGHEIDKTIDTVLQLEPARLRFILIDIPDFEYSIENYRRYSERMVWWHDGRRTVDALQSTFDSPVSICAKIVGAGQHFSHALIRFSGVGRIHSFAAHPPPVPQGGYGEYSREAAFDRSKYAYYLKQARFDRAHFLNKLVIRRQVADLQSRGIELAYVIPPVTHFESILQQMHEDGEIPLLFAYHQPAAYPDLFEWENRTSTMYLTRNGAEIYSRRIAEDFLENFGPRPTSEIATAN